MSLSDISIRRPVFAWMLMLAMIIFGYLAMKRMGISQLPDVDFPMVNIAVTYEGAAPEVMELDVIDPIESAVLAVEGVKNVTSSARQGGANISVEFNLEKNVDVAVAEIEARINQARRSLPDLIGPPVISKINPDDRPILWLSVSSDKMDAKDLMIYVRDNLKDKFQTISGVADVFLGGYVEPNLRVWVSNEKLNQYQFTVSDIINAIQTEHKESPSGLIEDSEKEKNVRTFGEAGTIEQFSRLPIIRRGGAPNFKPVFIGDIVDIEEGLADVRRISRFQGKTAVGLGIRKQRGSNSVEVARSVKKKMEEINKNLPPELHLGVNFDSTTFIEESIHELSFTMIMSAFLTAIVCWFFLGSFSATINVVLAIPTSILGAFVILKYMNFTLNTFTLLGLSLSIGIVVDDAIMVLENIYRHHEEGKDKVRASLEGANQISFAALAATIAIMAIFLPVAFMDGVVGKYFFQFGITISVAVGLSYIEALTLTPMRTSQFMEEKNRRTEVGKFVDEIFEFVVKQYERILDFTLSHRALVLISSLVFFIASVWSIKFVPKEFIPAQDTSFFMIRIKTPDGSSLAFTDQATKEVEKFLSTQRDVKHFYVAIGGFGGNESNSALMFVTLHKPDSRHKDEKKGRILKQFEILDNFRLHFKDFKKAKVLVQDMSQGGFSASGRGYPIEFTLTGRDWGELSGIAKKTMNEMQSSGIFTDIDTDYKESVLEVQVFPDREQAKIRGVSVQEIGTTISALIGGIVIGKYSKDGHRNDIRIKMAESSGNRLKDLQKIFIRNTRGELVRLLDVVTVKELPGVQTINRRQRQRAITIYASMAKGKSQGEAILAAANIARLNLKPGYELIESGSSETFKQTFSSFIFAFILGIVIAYMILAAQFNSFVDPVTVLIAALPFAVSGAILGLWATGQSLNMYSTIGLILLAGIVKKNSILLVDFTNQLKSNGLSVKEALKGACPKRLRAILMTTISTVAGATPLALSLGPGSESLKPMAIAIISGSLISTVLTLVVVPALYSLLSRERKMVS